MTSLRSHAWIFVTFALMLLAVPASGNEIQLTFTGTVGSYAASDVQNGGGVYMATYPGSSQLMTLCCTVTDQQGEGQFIFHFPEFSLPPGDKILSAKLTLLFPSELQHSYEPEITEILPVPDPDKPSVPGHILATVKTTTFADLVDSGCFFPASVTGFDLLSNGCNPNWDNLLIYVDSITSIDPSVISTGFNSAELFNVEGGNSGPISGELDITLTPEPSPLTLIGTGMMILLAGIAFRRRARATVGSMPMAN